MAKVKEIRCFEEVKMNLGGKERTLKFDLNAFAELENRFGSVQAAMEEMKSGGMKTIRAMVWVSLIHDEAVIDEYTGEPIGYNITPYQVGSWLTPDMLPEVSEKLGKAISNSMPDVSKIPGAAEELEKIQAGFETATVVYTPEELIALEAENLKNV